MKEQKYRYGGEKILPYVQKKRIKCVEDIFYNLESKKCELDSISEEMMS